MGSEPSSTAVADVSRETAFGPDVSRETDPEHWAGTPIAREVAKAIRHYGIDADAPDPRIS